MRWILICLVMQATLLGLVYGVPTTKVLSPKATTQIAATQPTTRSTTQASARRHPTIVVTTQPVSIPYKLTDTNHLLVRLKINGKGPFNFIVDTGAPVMILRVPAAEKLGLKKDARGFADLDQLDIEGGMVLKHVQCLVETPYQIEGMNAIGASGVELDGLLGYGVLARFRLQIDLAKDHMVWTPIEFVPPPFVSARNTNRPATSQAVDRKEQNLESMGGLMKVLGPMIKPRTVPSKRRGLVGIQLAQASDAVSVQQVLGESPADKAGIYPGDRILSINQTLVNRVFDAQHAMANILIGQAATIQIQRDDAVLTLHLTTSEGL